MTSDQSDLSPMAVRDIIHTETPRTGPNYYIPHIYMILIIYSLGNPSNGSELSYTYYIHSNHHI